MNIKLSCPGCKSVLAVEEALAGKTARCPKCKQAFRVPVGRVPVGRVPVRDTNQGTAGQSSATPPAVQAIPVSLAGSGNNSPEPVPAIPEGKGDAHGIQTTPGQVPPRVGEQALPALLVQPRRPHSRANRPGVQRPHAPALVWPWVVGGVAVVVFLLAIIAVVWLHWIDTTAPVVAKGPWAEKHNWGDKKEDVKFWPKEDKPPFQPPPQPFREVPPILVSLDDGQFQQQGQITRADTVEPFRFGKIYKVDLEAGKTYVIELKSGQFDSYLRLHDVGGRLLAADDDSGGALNSRIQFRVPARERGMRGNYKIIATSLGGQSEGAFTFSIREQEAGQPFTAVKLPPLVPPKSASPKQDLSSPALVLAGGSVTANWIAVGGINLVGDLCWSKEQDAFFTLDAAGTLRRIVLKDFVEERRLEIRRPCSWLAMSAEGLVVTVNDLQEAWLIDADSLEVKKRVAAPSAQRVLASAQTSIAVAADTRNNFQGALLVLDLAKGEPVRRYQLPSQFATMTPDGKYLFCQNMEQLQRIRINGDKLAAEDSGYRIAQNGQGINVSPDSKYVCLPSGGGNYTNLPDHPQAATYSTYVYPVDNLKKPAFTLPSGAYPRVVGFDPKGGHVFAQNHSTPLLVFSYTGLKQQEVKPPRGGGPLGDPRQFLAHPAGHKLLVTFGKDVLFVDLAPAPAEKTAKVEPGKQEPANPKVPLPAEKLQDNLLVRELPLGGAPVPQRYAWDARGEFLYILDKFAAVKRIRTSDFTEERGATPSTTQGLYSAGMSKEGLVVSDRGKIWLLDAGTLATIRDFEVPSAPADVLVSRQSAAAVIMPSLTNSQQSPQLMDLTNGQRTPLGGTAWKRSMTQGRLLSPDGNSLFSLTFDFHLQRHRLQGGKATLEEEHKVASSLRRLAQAPDGKAIAVFPAFSRTKMKGMNTLVFRADRLGAPSLTLAADDGLQALCLLAGGGHMQIHQNTLEVYSEDGRKIAAAPWPHAQVLALVAHPTQPTALALTGKLKTYSVEYSASKTAAK